MVARDKFWLFGVRAGQDDMLITREGRTGPYNHFGSQVKPAEAALYLDVPNMIMVNCEGHPVPYTGEAEQYAFTFTPMQKVLWSSTGSGGFRIGNEEEYVADLAGRYGNICGSFMDDFFGKFRKYPEPERSEKAEALLKTIRAGLDRAPRPMELYVVWYTHETEVERRLFQYIDGITLWTWNCRELPELEKHYQRLEELFPDKKKLLGVYLFDFPSRSPVPRELMEHQCELGLRLLREGRLDGMIFEANSVMGVGYPNDTWTREWIQRVKNTPVPD